MNNSGLPKYLVLLINRFTVYMFIIIFASVILLIRGWDTNDWYWWEEPNDSTFREKLLNRFYFSAVTFSTVGYGDITPKSSELKLLVSVLSILILTETMTFFFNYKLL